MVLKLYNTMSRKKEVFKPQKSKHVKFYSCGPTVYDDVHVGHVKTYAAWDVLTRYLQWRGYDVYHVRNFTDVGHLTDDADEGEDKILKRAKLRRIEPIELVDTYIQRYWEDMDSLNMLRPNITVRATQFIIEMQDFIKVLLDKGFAYEVEGNVYFDTSKSKDYGKLARLKLKDLKYGARIDVDKRKKHPRDFALWIKAPDNHIMKWTSPWGKGYPGWHLECSVMSLKYLGPTLDIHAGGADHIPVHHVNEIAQSEAFTGKPFVNYWLHSAFITVNGKKMSKSKGNFVTAREAINKWGAMPVKLALISSHYRSQSDFGNGMMDTAIANLDKVKNMIKKVDSAKGGKDKIDIKTPEKLFIKAMDDDLNTPNALAVILGLVKEINSNISKVSKKELLAARDKVIELLNVLGVKIELKDDGSVKDILKVINDFRKELRKNKQYELSDKLRNGLVKVGIKLEDQ